MKIIARIHSPYKEKFGIPRQSGIVLDEALIVFEKEFRIDEALRGIEDFSHLWLIWGFSENERDTWSPTVRPPRLGGNKRIGVFATRSSYRPNGLGLSSVKLLEVRKNKEFGSHLVVSGADLMDKTPIYDIKPYLAFTDSHPEARGSFADEHKDDKLKVEFLENTDDELSFELKERLIKILENDPRPHYHSDDREYFLTYKDIKIVFVVEHDILKVKKAEKI